jgi:hypothetical protein
LRKKNQVYAFKDRLVQTYFSFQWSVRAVLFVELGRLFEELQRREVIGSMESKCLPFLSGFRREHPPKFHPTTFSCKIFIKSDKQPFKCAQFPS